MAAKPELQQRQLDSGPGPGGFEFDSVSVSVAADSDCDFESDSGCITIRVGTFSVCCQERAVCEVCT